MTELAVIRCRIYVRLPTDLCAIPQLSANFARMRFDRARIAPCSRAVTLSRSQMPALLRVEAPVSDAVARTAELWVVWIPRNKDHEHK